MTTGLDGEGLSAQSPPVPETSIKDGSPIVVDSDDRSKMPPIGEAQDEASPNLLFIMTDQQRFDALNHVQNELADYHGKTKIKTPNLDILAARGAYFKNAYTASPVCAPARTALRTGRTIERNGVQSNGLAKAAAYRKMPQFLKKIQALETYEQILLEERGYRAETYGKWHIPTSLYYERNSRNKQSCPT